MTAGITPVAVGVLREGDANGDNAVTLLDFSLLASNYGQLGGPALSASEAPSTLGAGTVDLRLEPGSQSVSAGDVVTLTVWVEAGTQTIDGAQASLDFDPTQLQVVAVTGNAVPLPLTLQNTYNNTAGTVDDAAGTLGTQPTGRFALVEITFRVVATGGDAAVSFHHGLPRDSDVTQGGTSVLGTTGAVSWSLGGGGQEHVYLPTLSRP